MIICINHACSIGFKMTNHPLLLSKTFEPALRQTAKHLIITWKITLKQHITHKELFLTTKILSHVLHTFIIPTFLRKKYSGLP